MKTRDKCKGFVEENAVYRCLFVGKIVSLRRNAESDINMISIIMAAYNAENTIQAAINSALAQTYTDYEIIVVDDCSTDGTVSVVETYTDPRIRLLRMQSNVGVARARHEAIMQAKAEWIAILDSDDIWSPSKLEEQVQLQRKTGGMLIFTGSRFIRNDGTPVSWEQRVPESIGFTKLLRHNIISNSSTLVRKDIFLKYELLDDRVHEDYACWLRMLRDGYLAYGIDKPMLTYRLSTNARTANKWKSLCMNWRTLRAVGLSIPRTLYYMTCYTLHGLIKYSSF